MCVVDDWAVISKYELLCHLKSSKISQNRGLRFEKCYCDDLRRVERSARRTSAKPRTRHRLDPEASVGIGLCIFITYCITEADEMLHHRANYIRRWDQLWFSRIWRITFQKFKTKNDFSVVQRESG